MEIRKAQEDDIAEIAALERENFSDPWSEDSLRSAYGMKILVDVSYKEGLASGNAEMFGCPLKNTTEKVDGYIIIRTVAGESELLRICVEKNARRGGIGGKLLTEGLKLAKEDGAEKMFLEVRSKNDPAKALYEKAGFKEVGVRKNYYSDPQDDAVIMVLEMTAL